MYEYIWAYRLCGITVLQKYVKQMGQQQSEGISQKHSFHSEYYNNLLQLTDNRSFPQEPESSLRATEENNIDQLWH